MDGIVLVPLASQNKNLGLGKILQGRRQRDENSAHIPSGGSSMRNTFVPHQLHALVNVLSITSTVEILLANQENQKPYNATRFGLLPNGKTGSTLLLNSTCSEAKHEIQIPKSPTYLKRVHYITKPSRGKNTCNNGHNS